MLGRMAMTLRGVAKGNTFSIHLVVPMRLLGEGGSRPHE